MKLWSLAVALVGTLILVVLRTQAAHPVPCGGAGDCVKYVQMAQGFAAHHFTPIEAPFNVRLGAPWLASFMAPQIERGFLWEDAAVEVVFVAAMWGACRFLQLNLFHYAAVVLWFLFHPIGFLLYRAVPQSSDPLSYAMMALVILAFVARWRIALWCLLVVSLVVKESFVFVGLAAMAAELTEARERRAYASAVTLLAIVFLYSLLSSALARAFFPSLGGGGAGGTLMFWFKQALQDPNRFVVWIGSVLCATGFFWALAARRWDADLRNFVFLGGAAAGFVALGLVAGSDMSRIVFNGDPFILLFVMLLGRSAGPLAVSAAAVASLVMARNYMRWFPSTFEYGYYGSHDLSLTLRYVVVCLAVLAALTAALASGAWFKERSRPQRLSGPAAETA